MSPAPAPAPERQLSDLHIRAAVDIDSRSRAAHNGRPRRSHVRDRGGVAQRRAQSFQASRLLALACGAPRTC